MENLSKFNEFCYIYNMITVAETVREIVTGNPELRMGMAKGLMNLSSVARYIHPAVEARAKKPVRASAIAMALSRLQEELPNLANTPTPKLGRKITVQRGLAVLTFPNTARCREGLLPLQAAVGKANGHLTISDGVREITVIVDQSALPLVKENVRERPAEKRTGIASLSVALTRENLSTPGVLYRLLEPLALQGMNVAEVTSTTTEFHIYISEEDVMLALESLDAAFG